MSGHCGIDLVARSGDAIDLSVVLPSFRAASLAAESVETLSEFLGNWGGTWEVVVVDDGGHDFSPDAFKSYRNVQLLQFGRNRGKGAAVIEGMRAARGHVRIFTDVDLPYDLHLLRVIHEIISTRGAHVVIGDRTLHGSQYTSVIPPARRVASAAFSAFVGTLVTGGFFDTQCGLKGVRGDIADELFPMLRINRFAFDVELVYVALKHRLDIRRIPVRLINNTTSTVRLLRDASHGARDVLAIKWHQLRGHYRSLALQQIVARDFAVVSDHAKRPQAVALSPASDNEEHFKAESRHLL